jgi:type I site-specific restriction endonuclease
MYQSVAPRNRRATRSAKSSGSGAARRHSAGIVEPDRTGPRLARDPHHREARPSAAQGKDADRKEAILKELKSHGVFLGELAEQVGKDFDAFDLICHVAFDQPPLTRKERAGNVRKRNYFTKYGDKARAVLEALLDKYADEGIESIETLHVLNVQPFRSIGVPLELLSAFGGKDQYLQALKELEAVLYSAA